MTKINDLHKKWMHDKDYRDAYEASHDDASDYVRDMSQKDQVNPNPIVVLQKAITEGLNSGLSEKNFDAVIQIARQSLKTPD